MKRNSTIFLQVVTVLIGTGILCLMLWEPHLEGRNVQATLFEIYFTDPFLAYVYIGSIPFFVGLYHVFKVLGYIRQNNIFSQLALKALRTIKYCALITAGAILGADAYLFITARFLGGTDDPAGAVMLGMVATLASIIVAITAGVLEEILQSVGDVRSKTI